MTALLTDILPLLAVAPNGIRKLRELILELAVRGKLVPQDPNDEPASELLKRIAAEKARLMAEGKIKKQKPLAAIAEEEKSYDLPAGWVWQRFGKIFSLEYGNNLPADKRSNTGEYPVYGSNGIVGTHNECFVSSPCIVVGRKGSAGALNLCLAQGCCVTDVAYYCIPPSACVLHYVFKLFQTLDLDSLGKGIKPGLNRNEVYDLVVALPPFSEQHRIVAKVDELMALCDRLEARQADAESAHAELVQALLDSLTRARDATDFAANWQRLSEHFHTLFTTEASIDALKQALLQLAVMGKLVPQDPSDEPAIELAGRICEAGRLASKDKGGKASAVQVGAAEGINGVHLPLSWQWIKFDELVDPTYPIAYGVLVPGPDVKQGVPLVRISDLDLKAPPGQPEKKISPEVDRKYERTRIRGGEVLMGVVGSIGKLGIAPDSWAGANIARAVCRIVPSELVSERYVIWLLQSGLMRDQFIGDTRTLAQPTLNIGLIRSAAAPLPPRTEQDRIVAKLDQMMAMCDELKAGLSAARQMHNRLADELVEQAVA